MRVRRRSAGFGVQWTGEMFGLSLRYWFNAQLAAELDVLFLPGMVANIAVRGLLKPQLPGWEFDAPQTDFYLGSGVGLLDVAKSDSSLYLQGGGRHRVQPGSVSSLEYGVWGGLSGRVYRAGV